MSRLEALLLSLPDLPRRHVVGIVSELSVGGHGSLNAMRMACRMLREDADAVAAKLERVVEKTPGVINTHSSFISTLGVFSRLHSLKHLVLAGIEIHETEMAAVAATNAGPQPHPVTQELNHCPGTGAWWALRAAEPSS